MKKLMRSILCIVGSLCFFTQLQAWPSASAEEEACFLKELVADESRWSHDSSRSMLSAVAIQVQSSLTRAEAQLLVDFSEKHLFNGGIFSAIKNILELRKNPEYASLFKRIDEIVFPGAEIPLRQWDVWLRLWDYVSRVDVKSPEMQKKIIFFAAADVLAHRITAIKNWAEDDPKYETSPLTTAELELIVTNNFIDIVMLRLSYAKCFDCASKMIDRIMSQRSSASTAEVSAAGGAGACAVDVSADVVRGDVPRGKGPYIRLGRVVEWVCQSGSDFATSFSRSRNSLDGNYFFVPVEILCGYLQRNAVDLHNQSAWPVVKQKIEELVDVDSASLWEFLYSNWSTLFADARDESIRKFVEDSYGHHCKQLYDGWVRALGLRLDGAPSLQGSRMIGYFSSFCESCEGRGKPLDMRLELVVADTRRRMACDAESDRSEAVSQKIAARIACTTTSPETLRLLTILQQLKVSGCESFMDIALEYSDAWTLLKDASRTYPCICLVDSKEAMEGLLKVFATVSLAKHLIVLVSWSVLKESFPAIKANVERFSDSVKWSLIVDSAPTRIALDPYENCLSFESKLSAAKIEHAFTITNGTSMDLGFKAGPRSDSRIVGRGTSLNAVSLALYSKLNELFLPGGSDSVASRRRA